MCIRDSSSTPEEVTDPKLLKQLNGDSDDKSGLGGAAEAGAASLAEGVGQYAGFKAGMNNPVTNLLSEAAETKLGPVGGFGVKLLGGMVGNTLAHTAERGIENATGISQSIDQAKAAHPVISAIGENLPFTKDALSSVANLSQMGAKEAAKRIGVGGAIGAGMVYPQYKLDQLASSISGQPVPTQAPGLKDYAQGFGFGGLFGGAGEKPQAEPKPVDTTGSDTQVPLKQDEQAAFDESLQKINQVASGLDEADSPATAQELRNKAAKQVAAVETPEATETTEPAAPQISKNAIEEADKLGVDISEVTPNKFGMINVADVRKHHAATQTLQQAPPPEAPAIENQQTEQSDQTNEEPVEDENDFLKGLVKQGYTEENGYPTDVLQNLYRAKDKKEFVDWMVENYSGAQEDPSVAEELYDEVYGSSKDEPKKEDVQETVQPDTEPETVPQPTVAVSYTHLTLPTKRIV